jgi:predicted ATPase
MGGGYIESVSIKPDEDQEPIDWNHFPFTIPAIREMGVLKFHPAVTFLAGENGSGKSTLLEAIAVRLGYGEQGGTRNMTQLIHREVDGGLHDYIRVCREGIVRRESDGFFLRAESFFNVASRIDEYGKEDGRIYASYGGFSLHNRSHGEAFIALVQNRFHDESLFLLDEPEAALSPSRQIVLLKEINWLVKSGCQFIIATHSPILMAYPESTIYWLDEEGIRPRDWKEIEHVELTKSFLDNPKVFLRHLLSE